MGLMTKLFGGRVASNSNGAGAHQLNHNHILSPTTPGVITPTNPGNFDSIRSVPLVNAPRYFDRDEANALRELATEKAEGARQSQRAYKSLSKIEAADATVHRAHRKYQGNVADSELDKKRADAKLGRHLHAIRPDYARLGSGLERAELGADRRIAEIQAAVKRA